MTFSCGLQFIPRILSAPRHISASVLSCELLYRAAPAVNGIQSRGVKEVILHKEVVNRSKQEILNDRIRDEHRERVEAVSQDMPIEDMKNPYERPYDRCIICEHNIDLDYKNVRLLSQFVSPYTGMIYGRQHTGLCQFMQRRVSKLIKRARYFGFLPYRNKDPRFLYDPKLFDPFAPRKNRS